MKDNETIKRSEYTNMNGEINEKFNIKSYYKKMIDNTFSMWPHSHQYLEIMEILSGSIYLDIFENKTLTSTLLIQANTVIIIASSCYHRVRPNDEALITNLEFERSYSKNNYVQTIAYLNNNHEWNHILKTKNGITTFFDANGINKSIDSIINRISKVGLTNHDIYTDSLIFHLFIKLIDSYKIANRISNSGTFFYNKAMTIIKREIGNDISVSAIASELGITVSYLERIFKDVTKTTVMKYINFLKMDLVKEQLINTDESIHKLYQKYGFKSLSQFVYQFKQIYQMTPKKYKEKYNNKVFIEENNDYSERSFEIQ